MARRILAGLLALALLILPAAPLRHAAAAPAGPPGPCLLHGEAAATHLHHPAETQVEPCSEANAMPGLACCAAAQCPAMIAAPPPGADALPAPRGLPLRRGPEVTVRSGIDIAPTLPPPRDAA